MWIMLPAPLRNDELSAMSFNRQLKTELYTLEHIILVVMLVTVFTVRVGEHNFNVIILNNNNNNNEPVELLLDKELCCQ